MIDQPHCGGEYNLRLACANPLDSGKLAVPSAMLAPNLATCGPRGGES